MLASAASNPVTTKSRLLEALPLLLSLLLSGCASIVEVREHYNLTSISYGDLQVKTDPTTREPILNDCQGKQDQDASRVLSAMMVVGVRRLFLQTEVVDENIRIERLEHHFLTTGSDRPRVAIIDRDNTKIYFWHDLQWVWLYNVQNAAQEYCARRKATFEYLGSALKCGNIGGTTLPRSLAISGFACTKS